MLHLYARLVISLALSLGLFARISFAQTTVFSETFNSAEAPALPAGWIVTSGNGWKTDGGSVSSGSGGNNLAHTGTQVGTVVTPVIDLSGVTSGELTYLGRRTSSYDQSNMSVTASTDGGDTFPVTILAGTALPSATSSWAAVTAPLPAALLGQAQVVVRFEALGGTSASSNARIDDVIVSGLVAAAGGLTAAPASLAFSAAPGATKDRTVTVSNSGSNAVQLSSPVVTGTAFSISPTGANALAAGVSAEFTVTFSPQAPGTYAGTVTFADDGGGSASVALSGTSQDASLAAGTFGFSAPTSRALEESNPVDIPLTLSFSNDEPLQGLQFSVVWDSDVVQFSGMSRGQAVSDEQVWQLSFEDAGTAVTAVLLGQGTTGLPAGTYADFLTLQFQTGAIGALDSLLVHFAVGGIVGALAAPTGDDAGLAAAAAEHTLTLERRKASLTVSPPVLDLPAVAAGGSVSAELTVSNDSGTRDLTIFSATSSNALFSILPDDAVIPPGKAAAFTVTFSPTRELFGLQAATITFTHDGDSGPVATVAVSGTGVGGRGDTDGDGIVDIVDLIEALDFVLGRRTPGAEALVSADLYPFPEGDGALDVRDLTVMAQAIARGIWPDEVSIPLEVQPGLAAGKMSGVEASLLGSGGGVALFLEHRVPIRGVQLVLDAPVGAPQVVVEGTPADGSVVLTGYEDGAARILFYRTDGGTIDAGRYRLALFPEPPGAVGTRYATAVDAHNERVPVTVTLEQWTEREEAVQLPDAFRLGQAFPNPFLPGGAPVRMSIDVPEAADLAVAVYDVIGRQVATLFSGIHPAGTATIGWSGMDAKGRAVAPGLYLVQARTTSGRIASVVVVVQ